MAAAKPRRGRPPGSKNRPKGPKGVTQFQKQMAIAMMGFVAPTKANNYGKGPAKRGPGRPPKAKTQSQFQKQMAAAMMGFVPNSAANNYGITKRGRGRPRGSKNKTSIAWASVSPKQMKVAKEKNQIPLSVLQARMEKLATTIQRRL